MTTLASSEYTFCEYSDFSKDDIYLLNSQDEQPHEIERVRTAFKALTNEVPDPSKAELILDELVDKGEFEKFEVRMGWKTEIVWRKLVPIEQPVEMERVSVVKPPKFIKIAEFSNHLLSDYAEMCMGKNDIIMLGKAVQAGAQLPEGFNKESRRANCEVRNDLLGEILTNIIETTRGLNKSEWLGKVDSIVEGFNGK